MANRHLHYFHVVMQPLRNGVGVIDGHVTMALDVTERKLARVELESARRAAEAANRAKDEFLAMLGHELEKPASSDRLGARVDGLGTGGPAFTSPRRDRAPSPAPHAPGRRSPGRVACRQGANRAEHRASPSCPRWSLVRSRARPRSSSSKSANCKSPFRSLAYSSTWTCRGWLKC